MTTQIGVELIRLIPSVLWFILFVGIFMAFRGDLLSRIHDLTGLKMGPAGVEATFIVREIEKAEKTSGIGADRMSTSSERSIVAKRAERSQEVFRGARLLWVDDNPRNNQYVSAILITLGVTINTAVTTLEALDKLSRQKYDVVVTDFARGDEERAGITLLNQLVRMPNHPHAIVYSMHSGPEIEGAFGSATRPDQLLHLIFDVLERER